MIYNAVCTSHIAIIKNTIIINSIKIVFWYIIIVSIFSSLFRIASAVSCISVYLLLLQYMNNKNIYFLFFICIFKCTSFTMYICETADYKKGIHSFFAEVTTLLTTPPFIIKLHNLFFSEVHENFN